MCTVELEEDGRPFRVAGVAKFSDRDSAQKEIENHNRYVKWMLPYTWRVDIIGVGETQRFGAVCYSFAHGGGSALPITLATVLKARGIKQISEVIQAVFDPGSKAWYEQVRPTNKGLGVYLSAVLPYFGSAEELGRKADMFRSHVSRICARNRILSIEKAAVFLYPVSGQYIDLGYLEQKIYSQNWGIKARECICHGDLNAGNIMIKPHGSDFAFIDFRHTGWHHLTKDFCALEGSIRTLHPRDKDVKSFSRYFERELERQAEEAAVFSSDAEGKLKVAAIQEYRNERRDTYESAGSDRDAVSLLRAQFHLNFPESSYEEYLLGMLTHCWWMLSFTNEWAEPQVEILVAEMLACIHRLQLGRGI